MNTLGTVAAIWGGPSFFVGGLFCLRPAVEWWKRRLDSTEPPLHDPDNLSGATS